VAPEDVVGLALSPDPRERLAAYALEEPPPAASPAAAGSHAAGKGSSSSSSSSSLDSKGSSAVQRHVVELLRELDADPPHAGQTPAASLPPSAPVDLSNRSKEQYIALIRKVWTNCARAFNYECRLRVQRRPRPQLQPPPPCRVLLFLFVLVLCALYPGFCPNMCTKR
jgi:hypothetical protein